MTATIPQTDLATPLSTTVASAVFGELLAVEDDLARLSVLLNASFSELLAVFDGIQQINKDESRHPRVDLLANRAITALQCEDLAKQLIAYTQKRLDLARVTLQNGSQMPQIEGTESIHRSPLSTILGVAGPVRQQEMSPGAMELF